MNLEPQTIFAIHSFLSYGFKDLVLVLINQESQQYMLCIHLVQHCNKYWIFHWLFHYEPSNSFFTIYSIKDTEALHYGERNVGHSDENACCG